MRTEEFVIQCFAGVLIAKYRHNNSRLLTKIIVEHINNVYIRAGVVHKSLQTMHRLLNAIFAARRRCFCGSHIKLNIIA